MRTLDASPSASSLRILPDQLQDGSFDNPLLVVQSEQLDGDLTNLCQLYDASAVESEVLLPRLDSWIEEPDERTRGPRDGTNISAFGAIAAGARKRQIGQIGDTYVLTADDMIHFAARQQRPFRHPAILTTSTRSRGDCPA